MRSRIRYRARRRTRVRGGLATSPARTRRRVADLDAEARAVGNRRERGRAHRGIHFRHRVAGGGEPGLGQRDRRPSPRGHPHLGREVSRPITRDEFLDEVVTVVRRAFAAAPAAEEVDVWASVPIDVTKGEIVSGDLARPTSRTVFSLTVRRGETVASVRARADRWSDGVFWDPQNGRAKRSRQAGVGEPRCIARRRFQTACAC